MNGFQNDKKKRDANQCVAGIDVFFLIRIISSHHPKEEKRTISWSFHGFFPGASGRRGAKIFGGKRRLGGESPLALQVGDENSVERRRKRGDERSLLAVRRGRRWHFKIRHGASNPSEKEKVSFLFVFFFLFCFSQVLRKLVLGEAQSQRTKKVSFLFLARTRKTGFFGEVQSCSSFFFWLLQALCVTFRASDTVNPTL